MLVCRTCARPQLAPTFVVFGTMVLATTASAQTQPLPTLPPEQPPDVAPATPGDAGDDGDDDYGADGLGSGGPPQWQYSLGVGAGYDSNINYSVVEGPSSWAITPRGGLSRTFTSPRGSLGLSAWGRYLHYTQQTDLDRYYANVGVVGTHRPSLSTTWRAAVAYGLDYTDTSPILTDQGVLLPLVKTHTGTGSLGWSRTLGLRTSMRIDARYYYTHFDEQDAAALRLVDGHSLRGTIGFEHGVGMRDGLGYVYSVEAARSRSSPLLEETNGRSYYLTHFGSLAWNHVLSDKSGLLIDAGVSYTPESAQAGLARRASFYGGASYSLQTRDSSFSASVRREVAPAFGLGVSRVVNRFGLGATFSLGRAWILHVDGTYVLPENPEGALNSYGSRSEAFVRLARRLGRHFDISGEARYRHREGAAGFPDLAGYQAGLFVSFFGPAGTGGHRFGQ
jgi:hypothetical protein